MSYSSISFAGRRPEDVREERASAQTLDLRLRRALEDVAHIGHERLDLGQHAEEQKPTITWPRRGPYRPARPRAWWPASGRTEAMGPWPEEPLRGSHLSEDSAACEARQGAGRAPLAASDRTTCRRTALLFARMFVSARTPVRLSAAPAAPVRPACR